jgi:hypothetical protein
MGMKQSLIAIGCILLLILIVTVVWSFDRPPLPLSRLERLHTTMTTNEVRHVLGVPSSSWIRTNEAGFTFCEWAYSRAHSWPIVYVYFKPDGTFDGYRYDR